MRIAVKLECMRVIEDYIQSTDAGADIVLQYACSVGNLRVATFAINHGGAHRCRAIYSAAEMGHILLVDMISQQSKLKMEHWRAIMQAACKGGNTDMVQWMINRINIGDMNLDISDMLAWGLSSACSAGHPHIVLMVGDEYVKHEIDMEALRYGQYGACRGKHIEIVRMMAQMIAQHGESKNCYYCGELHTFCDEPHVRTGKVEYVVDISK